MHYNVLFNHILVLAPTCFGVY